MLGFSSTSPDLVICGDSPELLMTKNCNNLDISMELSLENGINGPKVEVSKGHKTPTVKFSNVCQTFEQEEELLSPEASFELHPPLVMKDGTPQDYFPSEFNSCYL